MAQRIGPAGSVRVAISGTISGNNFVNVFWASLTTSGTPTQSDLDDFADNFGAAYVSDLLPHTQSYVTLSTIQAVYFVDGTAGNVMESTRTLTGTGSGTTVRDAGLCLVLSWESSAYWRGGKPRTYLPGATANISATAESQWSSATLTTMQTQAAAFLSDANAVTGGTAITGTALGFVSFFTQGAPRTPPLFYAFSGAKIHPRIAHQRRRDGKWLQ